VLPPALATGEIGAHYRLGWEEKKKSGGKEAVPGLIDLPDRLPEAPKLDVPQLPDGARLPELPK